jgi:crotonobetainyl-CoA:carnitine CoA-transferase CaiB-like acyl-CoA transferase
VSERSAQPLSGIRVVDLTHDWAGPHAARVVADYGAEVIKIEYPKRLDGMRGAYLDRIDKHPRWWQINRNKKSITLDFHRPDHVEACKALVKVSDLVLENSRPGVLEGFGLGYETLRQVRPDIIMVSMSAHGGSGPYRQYAGYGGAIEATSGVQSLTAYGRGEDAMRIREVDVTNGIMGACAIMTALIHRQATGEGQWIDLSETEACTWLIGEHLLEFTANRGAQTLPLGNRHPVHAPQGCYPCRGKDRWLAITVRSDSEWRDFCATAGHPEWSADDRFATVKGRQAHHDEIDRLIASWTREQDAREAMITLQARGVAAGLVADAEDIANDPHLSSRGWESRPDSGEHGRSPGFPFRFQTEGAARYRRRGPDLGADNNAILRELLGLPATVIPPLDPEHLGTAFDRE